MYNKKKTVKKNGKKDQMSFLIKAAKRSFTSVREGVGWGVGGGVLHIYFDRVFHRDHSFGCNMCCDILILRGNMC